MKSSMCNQEKKEFIFARLRLAQKLLEESDRLEGRDGYDFDGSKWWFHPRHEREALVVYLLLTCFDKLGQQGNFLAFGDWLRSKTSAHTAERDEIIDSLPEETNLSKSSLRLFEKYQAIYGVKNSFCEGVMSLPERAKERFLRSVSLTFNAEYGIHGPSVSTPSRPLEDKELELRLKLKYLYEKRNRFTHKLDQYHSSSVPILSEHELKNGSSWCAKIRNARLSYMGVHQEHETVSTGGAYVYKIRDWPFVLFESLYDALGIEFDRTSIQLKFMVMVYSDDMSSVTTYNDVEHIYLKSCDSFLKTTGA